MFYDKDIYISFTMSVQILQHRIKGINYFVRF